MGNRVQNIRKVKFEQQRGHCAYCCQPMWECDPVPFAQKYGLSLPKAKLLRSTAEHLTARQDCGCDTPANIVAACIYCNSKRHQSRQPKPPTEYARKVRRRLQKGKWHGIKIAPIADPPGSF